MKTFVISAALVVALSTASHAQMLDLGPSTGLQSQVCDLISSGGGQIDVDCITPAKGNATFGTDSGPYVLGTMNAFFGPKNASNVLPAAGSILQSFKWTGVANQTSGTITWDFLDLSSELKGVYIPASVTGTPAFTAAFQPGTPAQATLTFGGSFAPSVLLQFPGKSGLASVGSGEIMGHALDCRQVTTTVCD